MGDRSAEHPQSRRAVAARQCRLRLAQRFGRPLALGQVEHESDARVRTLVVTGDADKDRHTAAILVEKLLLVREEAA